MFNELRNVFGEQSLKIVITESCISINNYVDILLFDEDKIIIKTKDKLLKIKGYNLLITRLENNEIEVKGNIKVIDLGD